MCQGYNHENIKTQMQYKWFPCLLSHNLILKLDEIKQRESRQRKQCISICYKFPYLRLDSFLIKIRTEFFPRLFSGTVLMFFMCILLFISYNIMSNYPALLKGCLFVHRQTALLLRNNKMKIINDLLLTSSDALIFDNSTLNSSKYLIYKKYE